MTALRETLLEIRELLDGYVDTRDGGALGPLPNDAMRAQQLLDKLLASLEQPHPATLLRATVERCPNGCPCELVPSEHADGLHLTCRACGFYATEEHARRTAEKIQGRGK